VIDFFDLTQECAPDVHYDTMRRIAHVESSFNPFAIGVVRGRLDRQPRNQEEAMQTATRLEKDGFNYSVGLMQVNKKNFAKYELTLTTAFDPCLNVKAGAEILKDCFFGARSSTKGDQAALRAALSCYYSGNYSTGFRDGYVQKVAQPFDKDANRTVVVPDIRADGDTAASDDAVAASEPLLLQGRRNIATDGSFTGRVIIPRNRETGTARKSRLKYESEPESDDQTQPDK
jgi:type IV secretion system protein VirB1